MQMNRASYQKIPNLTLGQKRAINSPANSRTAQKPIKSVKSSSPVLIIALKPQGRTVLSLKH